jgi:hypothetical protein
MAHILQVRVSLSASVFTSAALMIWDWDQLKTELCKIWDSQVSEDGNCGLRFDGMLSYRWLPVSRECW